MNYYNEHDPKAAAWLRELIRTGEIPDGDVDERSITDVSPYELTKYTQHHFFAGIGGWPLALRLAGWPEDKAVWTGSCPCQPFAAAGKKRGTSDPRHLWPQFNRLIGVCRPPTIFGEQVASKDALGWLDGVFADLEAANYACGAVDLCAAGVGAPHIRQRLFWVADAGKGRCKIIGAPRLHEDGQRGDHAFRLCENGRLGDAKLEGLEGHTRNGHNGNKPGRVDPQSDRSASAASRPWNYFDLLPCSDGKTRRIEPGTSALAHGIPGRVGLLRGYGNAIVPTQAAEFIESVMDFLSP